MSDAVQRTQLLNYGEHGVEAWRQGRTVGAELCYPTLEGNVATLEVGLNDVRSADSLLISYDFERDGWSIKQASRFEWDADDDVCDPDWQEVAFVQSWARRVPGDDVAPGHRAG